MARRSPLPASRPDTEIQLLDLLAHRYSPALAMASASGSHGVEDAPAFRRRERAGEREPKNVCGSL